MIDEWMRPSDHREIADLYLLRCPHQVRTRLWVHGACLPGTGNSPESCSARRQLLAIYDNVEWTWNIPGVVEGPRRVRTHPAFVELSGGAAVATAQSEYLWATLRRWLEEGAE